VGGAGRHSHVVAGVCVDDGAVFAVEAQRAFGDEEGLIVHFVPLLRLEEKERERERERERGREGGREGERDGSGVGSGVRVARGTRAGLGGGGTYVRWWAGGSGRDSELGRADAVVWDCELER
jgi:hypothetical protein